MVCKISAILSLPGCVNTLWQRQSDLYFEDNIFNFISNFRWNLNKIYKFTYLKWQSCFGCNALRARQNGTPFKMIYSNKFSRMELFHYFFFQIWLKCISKFPYRNLLYHLNILLWEGIKRRYDVIKLETFSLMHRAPWVPCTKGQWYRDIFTRV